MKILTTVLLLTISANAFALTAYSNSCGNETRTNFSDGSSATTVQSGSETKTTFSDGSSAYSSSSGDSVATTYVPAY